MSLRLSKLERVREEAPIILNVVKDSGWCYAFGIVSVVAFVPVFTFQCYEAWRARKEGWHKVAVNLAGAVAVLGNATWMASDIFFHEHWRTYAKWVFNVSFLAVGLYVILAYLNSKKPQTPAPSRTMMVSPDTKSIIFVHSKLAHLPKPSVGRHASRTVRHRYNHTR